MHNNTKTKYALKIYGGKNFIIQNNSVYYYYLITIKIIIIF